VLFLEYIIRESCYLLFLHRKHATRGTDGKREQTTIRKSRGSLVDSFTQHCQIAIESAIIERTQFHMDRGGVAHDTTRESEKRNQP